MRYGMSHERIRCETVTTARPGDTATCSPPPCSVRVTRTFAISPRSLRRRGARGPFCSGLRGALSTSPRTRIRASPPDSQGPGGPSMSLKTGRPSSSRPNNTHVCGFMIHTHVHTRAMHTHVACVMCACVYVHAHAVYVHVRIKIAIARFLCPVSCLRALRLLPPLARVCDTATNLGRRCFSKTVISLPSAYTQRCVKMPISFPIVIKIEHVFCSLYHFSVF